MHRGARNRGARCREAQSGSPNLDAPSLLNQKPSSSIVFRSPPFSSTSSTCSKKKKKLFHSFQRGLQRKSLTLIKKLRSAKRTAAANNEKPDAVRTHLRNTVIVPEMIGSVIGVYNGKTFNQVEVKPDMVGHYLGEFSISYKPVKHGKAGIGSTTSSRFIPLK